MTRQQNNWDKKTGVKNDFLSFKLLLNSSKVYEIFELWTPKLFDMKHWTACFLAGKLKYLNLESFEQKKNWILGQKLGYSHRTVWAPLLFCQGAELM